MSSLDLPLCLYFLQCLARFVQSLSPLLIIYYELLPDASHEINSTGIVLSW